MSPALGGYGPAHDEAERLRVGEVLAEAFAFPAVDAPGWFAFAGHENVRRFREGGAIVGGLLLIPMGQYFGGRSVRLGGFSGVAVAPWARGQGVATRMMAAALQELRQEGFPLAGLYPTTQPFYRRVGFEQAGARFEIRGPTEALPAGRRELPMRPFTPADLPAIQRLYAELARTRHGWLDRGGYVWHRVQHPRGHTPFGYVVEEGDRIEGYTFLARVRKPNTLHDLLLTDVMVRTPQAARTLLAFLADHASMAEEVTWFGSAEDPLLLLLAEQRLVARVAQTWMLRLLDVPGALAARGYPRGLTSEVHLEVEDDVFPENAGRWVVEVAGGEGRVRAGGAGGLRGHVRALASLYSGHRSAVELARLGLLTGTPEALERADELFVSRPPAMPDMY